MFLGPGCFRFIDFFEEGLGGGAGFLGNWFGESVWALLLELDWVLGDVEIFEGTVERVIALVT